MLPIPHMMFQVNSSPLCSQSKHRRAKCLYFKPVSIDQKVGGVNESSVSDQSVISFGRGRLGISLSSLSDKREFEVWEAGDLESDLNKLKLAVAASNAATDLSQKERFHLLDEFARQRRDLYPDLNKYIFRPLILSLLLMGLLAAKPGHGNHFLKLMKLLCRMFLTLMNGFYSISIIVPILVYHLMPLAIVSSNKNSLINEFKVDETKQSGNDCVDHSRCLAENWASSIYLSAIFHTSGMLISRLYQYQIIQLDKVQHFLLCSLGIKLSRFVTRLGAAASLHQFPKLLYDLRRSNQPRPMAFIPTVMNKMFDTYMWLLPIGFSADFAQLCITLHQSKRYNIISFPWTSQNVYFRMISALFFMSILIPLAHLIAFKRIINVGHFSSVSLGMEQEKALQFMDEEEKNGLKLRYKLRWRPPLRLFHSSQQLIRMMILNFFSGWGEKASIVDSTVEASTDNPPYILTLVGNESRENKKNMFPPRSTWIKNACERIAKIHETNYRNKTFNDPLGIAYQQTFGLGASFDFDHDSRLKKGDLVSSHRLRARAAKSAIKCYNRVPMQVESMVKMMEIDNDEERAAIYSKLIEQRREEIKKIAFEIQMLISTNAPSPEDKDLDIFSMKISEAQQLDSVSLPWLKSSEDNINKDPYLSFEDAYLINQEHDAWYELGVENDTDGDIFTKEKGVLS